MRICTKWTQYGYFELFADHRSQTLKLMLNTDNKDKPACWPQVRDAQTATSVLQPPEYVTKITQQATIDTLPTGSDPIAPILTGQSEQLSEEITQ